MDSRGKRLLNLALRAKVVSSTEDENNINENNGSNFENEGSGFESDSESLSSLFGDPSSDEYQPDADDLSESDRENYPELQTVPYRRTGLSFIDNGVVGPSDEDDEDPSVPRSSQADNTYQNLREQPRHLLNSNENKGATVNFESEDDIVGPSDEDDEDPSVPRSSLGVNTYQNVREKPRHLLNSNENQGATVNFESEDDIVGPSDEDENIGEPRVRLINSNNNNHGARQQPLNQTSKKNKIFTPKQKNSRKRKRNPNEWVKRKAAISRQKGEAYTNYKGVLVEAKSVTAQNLCPRCRLKCDEKFTLANREAIFNQFYQLDTNAKNALLFGCIKICDVQRKRKGAIKHKSATFKYIITIDGKQTVVCKQAFANLFCIGRKKIDLIQKSIKQGLSMPSIDKRGKHNNRPHKIDARVIEYVKQHINEFPAEESHYSRTKNVNKKYLSPLLSISKMHKLYLDKCKFDNVDEMFYVKECTYRNVFVSEFNLSFGYPKSDTCSTCDAGEANEEHVQNYHEAYDALKADREKAQNLDSIAYMTMDLQQTMPLPRLSTSKAFYLRQLWMYNFGTHIITKEGDKAVFCSWTEDQASRGSSEIFSCLLTVIEFEESLKNKEQLIIWSDSCSGQNKNFLLICLYQHLISKGHFKQIDHKFPEVGHTYLDSDRDFGRIEKNLRKHQNIYSPEEYRHVIAKSSKKNQVIDMAQHFRDTQTLEQKLKLYNRKKDVNKNKIQFRDSIKWIRVEEYGSYLFKTTYDENTPFQKVNIYHKLNEAPSLDAPIIVPRLLMKTGSLKQPKVENLREQLIFIPDQHKWWYQNILDSYP